MTCGLALVLVVALGLVQLALPDGEKSARAATDTPDVRATLIPALSVSPTPSISALIAPTAPPVEVIKKPTAKKVVPKGAPPRNVAKARTRVTRKAPVRKPTTPLALPVRGPISSLFGYRHDPFYNVDQLHAGIDIVAGKGTPIRAAERGRVVKAGWSGGYGFYTCVDHGKLRGRRVVTCYAHQSKLATEGGRLVQRDQVIGYVGSTGASTGAHLHFEVRVNGSPADPRRWLR